MQRADYTAVSDGALRPLRLLLCDSMTLVRAGLRVLLSGEGVEIVGEAVTADEAVRLTQEVRPDAVLLDRDLPGDTVRAIREIKETVAGVQLIVMTESLDERNALRAIEVGAAGYMLKGVPVAHLAATMRAVCGGGTVNDAQLARTLLWPGHLGGRRRSRKPTNSESLTPREFEILVEIGQRPHRSGDCKRLRCF